MKKEKSQAQDVGDDGAARKKAAQEEHKRKREEAEAKKKALLEEKLAMSQHGLGVEELKGNRGTQEDRVTALRLPSGERLACVFDGHRGDSCSQFAMTRMPHSVSKLLSGGNDADEALRRAIGELHGTWQESGADKSGATSSVAIVLGGSVSEVPQGLLDQLAIGGRLIAIVGEEPVMQTTLFTRNAAQSWHSKVLWDTFAPPLTGFAQPSAFHF